MARSKGSARTAQIDDRPASSLHPALIPLFGYCFTKSALKHRKMLAVELAPLGLQPAQMAVLIVLAKSGPLNQISLGLDLDTDKATMVKLVDELEEAAYVKRKPDLNDRRVKFVELTARGRAIVPKLNRRRERVEVEFLKPLSTSEKRELRRLLLKLVNAGNF